MYRFWWLLIGLIVLLMSQATLAQYSDNAWVLLKTEQLDGNAGAHTVQVPDGQVRSHAVKLVLAAGKLELTRVVISYGNGQQHFEDREIWLSRGEQTPPIGEREESLIVESVSLVYRKEESSRFSTVQIWGQAFPSTEAASTSTNSGDKPRGSATASTQAKGYREIGVFFGTSRQQEANSVKNQRQIATFSGVEGRGLTLGQAVVTIPFEREIGSIPRPEIDLIVVRTALRREDPMKDFTIVAVDVKPPSEFIDGVKRMAAQAKTFPHRAFVFVHGYNVSFEDAIFRTAQIAHDIGFDGPAITFSWPSRGGMWDYRHDVDTAKSSRDYLLELLAVIAGTGVESVNVVAHSMGNDPLLEVLGKQGDIKRAGGTVQDLKLNEILLAAPDVSRTNFEQLAEQLKGLARGGVTLYASANDKALLASKKVASGLARAGDVPQGTGPLVVDGVETIDVSEASTTFLSNNHSNFAERRHLVEDMRLLFQRSKHPPDERFPVFRAAGAQPRQYWKYLRN